MTERTGEVQLGTEPKPAPLITVPLPTRADVRAAFQAYVSHAQPCDECRRRLYNCPEGKRLWAAYLTTRNASGTTL